MKRYKITRAHWYTLTGEVNALNEELALDKFDATSESDLHEEYQGQLHIYEDEIECLGKVEQEESE